MKFWAPSDIGDRWIPPVCTGWSGSEFSTLVTTVARFRSTSRSEDLLGRIGAISELKGLRYWSVTHKQWRVLIINAYALTAAQGGHPRADFIPNEMTDGSDLYFEQVDNLTGSAVYRLHIGENSRARLAIQIENVTTVRYLHVPIVHAQNLQSVYFLERESESTWRYYSIVRTGKGANRLIGENKPSAINRAIVFYRHLVGIPDVSEPPAAR